MITVLLVSVTVILLSMGWYIKLTIDTYKELADHIINMEYRLRKIEQEEVII